MAIIGRLNFFFTKLLTAVFIDSIWLHRFWNCHRLSKRSFFLNGRQFHICARCTGIFVGLVLSLSLIPFRSYLPLGFAISSIALFIDGTTQFLGWRDSNNLLRFLSGFLFGITLLPSLLSIGGI